MLKIKQVRQDLHITQEEIARHLNMSVRQWCRTEDGEVEPKLRTADVVYRYFVAKAAQLDQSFDHNIVNLFRKEEDHAVNQVQEGTEVEESK